MEKGEKHFTEKILQIKSFDTRVKLSFSFNLIYYGIHQVFLLIKFFRNALIDKNIYFLFPFHPGDTVFIILRKQRLIFLHWYHHITVLLYSWFSYKDLVAGGGWFMTMNYVVHSIMYTYYAARAAGLRVPRPCAMLITTVQILQMVMGLTVLGLVYHWMNDVHCPSNMDNIMWGTLMYLSYLVLFASFFYNTYLKDPSTDKGSKAN